MNRQHFDALAAALKRARPDIAYKQTPKSDAELELSWRLDQWRTDVRAIADALRAWNGDALTSLDRQHFCTACGYDTEENTTL